MITMETAARIWTAYREIEKAERLLEDVQEAMTVGRDANPEDRFGRRRTLQLGIPCTERFNRLLDSDPPAAVAVIQGHLAAMRDALVRANAAARRELDDECGSEQKDAKEAKEVVA